VISMSCAISSPVFKAILGFYSHCHNSVPIETAQKHSPLQAGAVPLLPDGRIKKLNAESLSAQRGSFVFQNP